MDRPPGTREGEEFLAKIQEEGTTTAKAAAAVVVVKGRPNGKVRYA